MELQLLTPEQWLSEKKDCSDLPYGSGRSG